MNERSGRATTGQPIPDFLGPYRVLAEIGSGGFASVYLAQRGDDLVAVKRMHPESADDPSMVDMFFDEARLAACIRHPNVVQVYESSEHGDERYITFEYVHGESGQTVYLALSRLTQLGRARYFPAIARIGSQLADALHAAHEATSPTGEPLDLVHRDVAPANYFVTYDGSVKLIDFGVAHSEIHRVRTTIVGSFKGRLSYASPEQLSGHGVDRRADIWSLAVLIHELCLGEYLFRREGEIDTLNAVLERPISSTGDERLDRILTRALRRNRDERYEKASDFGHTLRTFAELGEESGSDLRALMGTVFRKRAAARNAWLDELIAPRTTPSSAAGTALAAASATSSGHDPSAFEEEPPATLVDPAPPSMDGHRGAFSSAPPTVVGKATNEDTAIEKTSVLPETVERRNHRAVWWVTGAAVLALAIVAVAIALVFY